jgi:hypothetical protein
MRLNHASKVVIHKDFEFYRNYPEKGINRVNEGSISQAETVKKSTSLLMQYNYVYLISLSRN